MPGTLLIDDTRDPADFSANRVARNYDEAIIALRDHGPWHRVWFDHDLGYHTTKTGYDVMCWLERNPQYIPEHMALCTQNAVGREKMARLGQRLWHIKHGQPIPPPQV